jgi:hypothetical protein
VLDGTVGVEPPAPLVVFPVLFADELPGGLGLRVDVAGDAAVRFRDPACGPVVFCRDPRGPGRDVGVPGPGVPGGPVPGGSQGSIPGLNVELYGFAVRGVV